jgi:hypothetical protein
LKDFVTGVSEYLSQNLSRNDFNETLLASGLHTYLTQFSFCAELKTTQFDTEKYYKKTARSAFSDTLPNNHFPKNCG